MLRAEPASFRDPAGKVVRYGRRVLRVVAPEHAAWLNDRALSQQVDAIVQRGMLWPFQKLERDNIPDDLAATLMRGASVLEHPPLPLICYPYEWTFEMHRDAALAHLALHRELLGHGLDLSDASAFNMQPIDGRMVHIDTLSVIPYVESRPWSGYSQFLEMFFNPLVLEAATGVSAAAHFRGTMRGLSTTDLAALLPLRWRLKPATAMHVALMARAQRRADQAGLTPSATSKVQLPRSRLAALIGHLERTISELRSPPGRSAIWARYAHSNSYEQAEGAQKRGSVANWVGATRPARLVDIGCNTGYYSDVALKSGARAVIALDTDRAATDLLWQNVRKRPRAIYPLSVDFANPSPSQGWALRERSALGDRLGADAVMALAVVHHLAIGQNVPLDMVIDELLGIADAGLVEFVPKGDPMVTLLLSQRADIFPDYTVDAFRAHLAKVAAITSEAKVTSTGRVLFTYERRGEAKCAKVAAGMG